MNKELELKNFGFFFSTLFLILTIFFFLKNNEFKILLFFSSFLLFFLSILCPIALKYPSKIWEMVGISLGIIFSPIILTVIYCATIVPINFLMRILGKDLINLKFSERKTYWVNRKNKNITFKNQF